MEHLITQQTLVKKDWTTSLKGLDKKEIKDRKDQIVSNMLGPCFSFLYYTYFLSSAPKFNHRFFYLVSNAQSQKRG